MTLVLIRRRVFAIGCRVMGAVRKSLDTPHGTPLSLCCCMRFADFWSLTPLLLSLGRLPATHQLQALRGLAIPLIPPLGLIRAVTPPAQTAPQAKLSATGRRRLTESMLGMSQGRACSRWGRPRDLLNLSGIFFDVLPPLGETTPARNLPGRGSSTYQVKRQIHSATENRLSKIDTIGKTYHDDVATWEGKKQGRKLCRFTSTPRRRGGK